MFRILFLSLALFFLCSSSVYSQSQANLIARDVDVNGKVVFLSFPVSGIRFTLGWASPEGKQGFSNFESKKGMHIYDARSHPLWKGTMKLVVVQGLTPLEGEIRTPSFQEEINLFLEPELLTSRRTNFLEGYSLFGFRWHHILFWLTLITGGVVFFFRRQNLSLPACLLVGFLFSCFFTDLRYIRDHQYNFTHIEENYFVSLDRKRVSNMERAKEEMGEKSWRYQNLEDRLKNLLSYVLAEKEWKPETEEADLTFSSEKGELRVQQK